MKRLIAIAALTGTVGACSMSLSPEQQAELDREYRPVVNALIPACIATASGRKADYSAIKALGYAQRDAMMGSGDYLYPADQNSVLNSEGIRFVPGKGCDADHPGVQGVALGGMDEIGQVWVRALQSAGYQITSSSSSTFSFTANGVPLEFRGVNKSNGPITFSITRAR